MAHQESPEDREQRIQQHAAAADANDPQIKPPRNRRSKVPDNPVLERVHSQICDVIQELHELEEKLKAEPTVAALVSTIRQRLHKIDFVGREGD